MTQWNRRQFVLAAAGGALLAFPFIGRTAELLPRKGRRVVVIGGGFGGTIAARSIRQLDPSIEVVLVERNPVFTACPTSNLVIAGMRRIEDNQITYTKFAANHGIQVIHDEVQSIDAGARTVVLASGTLSYDRVVVSPGIDFRFTDLEGYDPQRTPERMPHAWKAGEQTLRLKGQLEAMADGGTVIITVPPAPFRCPPGPYERASLVAAYLKKHKPKSKVLVLDANSDIVSKGALFRKAWQKHYADIIDYRANHRVVKVASERMSISTEVEDFRGDVISLVPPQHAGAIAHAAGLVGEDKRWCPVDQTTFESTLAPGIHVLGDACLAGPMPKSGFSANTQAKVCARNLVALLNGRKPVDPSSVNVCYSFVAENEAITVSAVYKVVDGKTVAVPNAGGVSPDLSVAEATYGRAWIRNILAEMST